MGWMMPEVKILPCACGKTPSRNWEARRRRNAWRVECQCGVAGPWRSRAEDASVEWNEIVKAVNMHDRLLARVALAVAGCPLALHDGCDGDSCPQAKGCTDYQLLKEARGES